MKILNEAKVAQDDPRLIKVIKDQYIEPPSKLPYDLENWDMQDYSKLGMSPKADDQLNKKVSTILSVQDKEKCKRILPHQLKHTCVVGTLIETVLLSINKICFC